jgi:signal transduction histidine kinase
MSRQAPGALVRRVFLRILGPVEPLMDSRVALRITSIYVGLAGVWILASDSILVRLFPDAASRHQFSVIKGLAFVTLTGAVLFLLVRAQVHKLEGQRNRAEASNAELRQRDAELRHSLAERQRLYDELEARAHHSTSLEAQLRQSQKMEGIGRLAGGVAHDFNNMLTIILSAAELVPEELPPKHPAHALVDEIKDAAARCAALTRQLLIFSRKHVTQLELLDLNVQVADARKLLLRVIGEDITFTANLQATPAPVRLDPVHVQQLVVNLAVNARDAMPGGGLLLIETETREVTAEEVEAFPGVKPGPFVVLGLTDTGCGMSPKTIEHIFEPFFTTKPAGKGTGLGLATVYEIVSQAGGFVRVDSVVDQGTTFRLYLPLAAGEMQQAAAALPTPSRGGLGVCAARGGRGRAAHHDAARPAPPRLYGAGGAQRGRGAATVGAEQYAHPLTAHRRGHADHARHAACGASP